MSGDFSAEQKRYLEGFTSGLQIARAGRGFGGGKAAVAVPTGPDAEHLAAQDRTGYLEHALPHKKLKELRRQRRRLADTGTIEFVTAREPKDVASALGYFLALEASGWKGRQGSAASEHAPIRTFIAYDFDGEPEILASYTCTPLVRIAVDALTPGAKVMGTTIAELGNMNRPLDMIAYRKDGKDYILMANSNRGVMKVHAENLGGYGPITHKIAATHGVPYDTIEALPPTIEGNRDMLGWIRGERQSYDEA